MQKQVRRLYFVVACFTWLMGVASKERFLPTKSHNGDIMVANIRCKSHDYYSERKWLPPATCVEQATRQMRSRSRERGRVKLAWTASISLCRAIKNTQHRGLQQKTSMLVTSMLRSTRETHLRIDLALIPLKGFAV
jgi:hypothetical protein